MKKALIKLTGRDWPLAGLEVGSVVKAKLDTEFYTEEKGVYLYDGYEIFTKPNPKDVYENVWAGEVVGQVDTPEKQIVISPEQFEKAAKAVRESEWFGTGYEQAYAALTTLGISVEGDDE